MSRTVDNINITKNEMQAWQLRHSGLTIAQISKKMKKGTTTIGRWLKSYQEKAELTEKADLSGDEEMQALVDEALKGLKKSLKSKNENVRLKAQMFVLNGNGILVEQKKVEHSGEVNTTIDISEKLNARIDSLSNAIGGVANVKK